jgi:hypothetical protein
MRKFAFIKPLNYRMRKHIILFFSVLLLFVACKLDKTPPGVLKQDKMINLLTALHLVDGSLSNYTAPDSLFKYGSARYTTLFKKFHTDSAQLSRSIKYYSLHPDKFVTMYTEILKRLNAKQDSLNKVISKQTPKNALPPK